MKTKFFRNNAFVKASALVSRCLGKLGMTVVLLCPVVLAAQNGVKVSDLNVNAGTVTFNVSWDKTSPELQNIVWSDTVWVFVDYNAGGVMKRLPLRIGSSLTDISAGGEGQVIEVPGNDQGVWVAGNARSAGSFSATVQLLSTIAEISGACVYASNYPPVAEYVTASSITFTGTPPFDLVLSTGNVSVQTGYELVGSQTLVSFTDKTGAPGEINCVPPATPQVALVGADTVCQGTNVVFTVTTPEPGVRYTWSGSPGTASGPGNGTYTASGAVAGYGTVEATALRLTCPSPIPSDPSDPAPVLWLPKGSLSEPVPSCGCADPLVPCLNKCEASCKTYYTVRIACNLPCPTGRFVQNNAECQEWYKITGLNYGAANNDACYNMDSFVWCQYGALRWTHTHDDYTLVDKACVEVQ